MIRQAITEINIVRYSLYTAFLVDDRFQALMFQTQYVWGRYTLFAHDVFMLIQRNIFFKIQKFNFLKHLSWDDNKQQ